MKIGIRIACIAVVPIILTTMVIVGIALYQKGVLRDFFAAEIDRQARSEARKVAQSVYLMCRSAQESVQKTVDYSLRVAEDVLSHAGSVSFSQDKAAWTAVNQFTQERKAVVLPKMLVGRNWLGQNWDKSKASPIVDEVKGLVGGTATIFQRMNAQGDMLRVSTNVQNLDGSRAIGTYIPARNPGGIANPVVAALLRGEAFHGRAYVVNAWYVTAYKPIWDESREKVVGALYVGVKQENLESLRKGIMDIVVGKTGYVHVLGGTGEQRGRYIISKNGERDGENIWNSMDAAGRPFVQDIIKKGVALRNEPANGVIPVAFDNYPWKNPGERTLRHKTVAIAYFEPWDWVICAGYYDGDFMESRSRMTAALNKMAWWVAATALLVVLLSLPAGHLVAQGIRNRIDSIIMSVTDVMIVTDVHDRVVSLSHAAERLFGIPFKKARNQPIDEAIRDTSLVSQIKSALAQRKNGVKFDFEAPGDNSGESRIMEGRTSVIQGKGGGVVGMITVIHDVTSEREVDRMKSEFISTAAHELSTPLTSIIGYSEMLLTQPGFDPGICQDSLSCINRKAWALSRIVDDLLDISRIESGRGIPINKKPCDVNEIVHRTVQNIRNLSTRHEFELDLSPSPVNAPVDEGKIEEVMENILSNAIKYYPAGGVIRIEGTLTDNAYRISVEDRGIGMTREQTERIFDKFYRADASNTAIEGTGLGMTIVKLIIEAHGGKVWVESEPGKGTKVFVTLPLEDISINEPKNGN